MKRPAAGSTPELSAEEVGRIRPHLRSKGGGCHDVTPSPVSIAQLLRRSPVYFRVRLACLIVAVFGLLSHMHAAAEIAERELDLSGKTLHYLESGTPGGTTILLLHGARFSSQTWRELGTIDQLTKAGYYVVALDLPGFGKSQTVDVPRNELLVKVMDMLAIDEAVVVSPSMSGAFSFPLVIRATDRVLGFVPIAPGGIQDNEKALRGVSVPTLILWGEKDQIIPLDQSDILAAAITDSRRVILQGASHPCYLDSPERFHEELLGFVASLSR